jgi:hypothetical protein
MKKNIPFLLYSIAIILFLQIVAFENGISLPFKDWPGLIMAFSGIIYIIIGIVLMIWFKSHRAIGIILAAIGLIYSVIVVFAFLTGLSVD